MITPRININGTSREEHISMRSDALKAIQAAKNALQKLIPNGRDYPGEQDRCQADREEHYARVAQLEAIRNAIIDEAMAIMND